MKFLMALVAALLIGAVAAGPVASLAAVPGLRGGLVAAVMFVTGLGLAAAAAGRALTRRATWIAVTVNLAGVPAAMLGYLAVLRWAGLDPGPSIAAGLMVVTAVPCTLASAAVWTSRAGGDVSIAMAVTLITNGLCLVSVPVVSWIGIESMSIDAASIDPGATAWKLLVTVILPLGLAGGVRLMVVRRGGAGWLAARKAWFRQINQAGILVMASMGASAGMGVGEFGAGGLVAMLAIGGGVVAVHLLAMGVSIGLTRAVGGTRGEQFAAGIGGSQKTLLVGLQIAIESGGSVLPMLAYHTAQLLIDTVVADRWRRGGGG